VTTILGPFLGGVLVDLLSWRAAFFINVPILAVALWAALTNIGESRDTDAVGRFDWLGALIVALGIGGLGFGAIRGQESQWQDAAAFVALAIGAGALVLLPWRVLRARNPLVPPSLFRSRNFTVVNVATLLIYGAIYTVFYVVPVYLQGAAGYNAAAAGIVLASAMIFIAVFSPQFGKLATRFGPRWFMAGGPAVMAAGLLWFTRIPADTEPWVAELDVLSSLVPPGSAVIDVLPAMVVFGLGTMMMVAPLTTALMASVPETHSGVASAVNNTVARVGPQLATAAIFIVASSIFFGALGDLEPELDTSAPAVRDQFAPFNAPAAGTPPARVAAAAEASTDAFAFAMAVAAGLLGAASIVSAVGVRNPEKPAEDQRMSRRVPAAISPCPPLDVDCLPNAGDASAAA
jgi:MFS family permease